MTQIIALSLNATFQTAAVSPFFRLSLFRWTEQNRKKFPNWLYTGKICRKVPWCEQFSGKFRTEICLILEKSIQFAFLVFATYQRSRATKNLMFYCPMTFSEWNDVNSKISRTTFAWNWASEARKVNTKGNFWVFQTHDSEALEWRENVVGNSLTKVKKTVQWVLHGKNQASSFEKRWNCKIDKNYLSHFWSITVPIQQKLMYLKKLSPK